MAQRNRCANPDAGDRARRIQHVLDECLRRRSVGESLSDEAVVAEHPDLMPELAERLRALKLIEEAGRQADGAHTPSLPSPEHIEGRCPDCQARWRVKPRFAGRRARCKKCGGVFLVEASPNATVTLRRSPSAPELPAAIPEYEIESELGRGGMGRVYRAQQLSTKRRVALKVMLAGRYADRRQRRRFEREVEIAASLEHANIARIYASGLHEGHHWFAMEYVKGQRLDSYVAEMKLGIYDTLALFVPVCEAVNHAHRRGIMHRDLKPGNILVDTQGQPRVLDFGLAKLLDEPGAAEESISILGEIVGTPAYMSPEQAAGRLDQLDTRTDVYSLGVVLYRLLVGELPHDLSGSCYEVLQRIAEEDVRRPCELGKRMDGELEALLLKALAREPENRYGSAGELARDIGNYLNGEPLTAKRPTTAYFLRKRIRKYRARVAAACAVLAVVLGTVAYAALGIAAAKGRADAERARAVAALEEAERQAELAKLSQSEAEQRRMQAEQEAARAKWAELEAMVLGEREEDARLALETLEAEYVAGKAEVRELRDQLEEQEENITLAEAKIDRLHTLGNKQTGPKPPPPNPTNPVNYVEWINDTFGLENAADDYLAAYDRLEAFEGSDEDQKAFLHALRGPWSGNRKLSQWLASNRGALRTFREAAAKSKCFFPVPFTGTHRNPVTPGTTSDPQTDGLLISVTIPSLGAHRTAGKVLIVEGWRAWQQGDEEQLPENALVILRMAHHLYDSPWLIGRRVGIAVARRAYDALGSALELSSDPYSLAKRLLQQLPAADPVPREFRESANLHRISSWDICQRLFVPGKEPGTWALNEPFLGEFGGDPENLEWQAFLRTIRQDLPEIGFNETMREVSAVWDAFDEWCRMPYHLAADRYAEWKRSVKESNNVLIRTLTPSLSTERVIDERHTAARRATHLIAHLFAHRGKTGRFPRSLEELDAPDLEELRVDPFSGRDFVYDKTRKSFRLYSLADNLKDDEGQHDPTWNNGDYVFWPVRKRDFFGDAPYQIDFENGRADAWHLEPGWKVIQEPDGNWVLHGRGHGFARYRHGDSPDSHGIWWDSTFRLRLKVVRGDVHLNYRLRDEERYFVGFHEGKLSLHKTVVPERAPERHLEPISVPANLQLGRWYTVEITGRGNKLEISVDGERAISYVDPAPYLYGSIALESGDDSEVHVDDIVVIPLANENGR